MFSRNLCRRKIITIFRFPHTIRSLLKSMKDPVNPIFTKVFIVFLVPMDLPIFVRLRGIFKLVLKIIRMLLLIIVLGPQPWLIIPIRPSIKFVLRILKY